MLSYQHIYHAGGPADLHKHSVLCAVLEEMCASYRTLTYMETHAGRGLYDLGAPEALKTGEAAQGWLAPGRPDSMPPGLRAVVRSLNDGADVPLYPGSPMIAARLLRPSDRLHLFELHPQEHTALVKAVGDDPRIAVTKKDGYEGVMEASPPNPRRGVVLIDPSFEIKEEYSQTAVFIDRLHRRWREAAVLLWYPLLPAARHKEMIAQLAGKHDDLLIHEFCWAGPDAGGRGMYGSGMAVLNLPFAMNGFVSPVS